MPAAIPLLMAATRSSRALSRDRRGSCYSSRMGIQDIVIIGAGGFGREVEQWIADVNQEHPRFHVRGFLDADPARHGGAIHDLPVLGYLEWLDDRSDCAAVIAIGGPRHKFHIAAELARRGVATPPIVHPRALIGRDVVIGTGTVVCPDVILTTDIAVGAFSTLNIDLTVGHDARIHDFVTLAPGVHVSGNVVLEEGCELGTGVNVVPGVRVGGWSIVGAGATVASDIPANVTAVGIPAKAVKSREPGWHLR
jgi:sugar O-acyltransferase (sialic acid O-acetyltransferase NeuD family)